MALTNINVCNRALLQIGATSIASFSDDSNEARACEVLYDEVKETGLSLYPWRFASVQIDLGDPAGTDPLAKWERFWAIPSQVIRVNTVLNGDYPVDYDSYQGQIACNAGASDTLTMDAVVDIDESEWPPHFTNYIVFALAAVLAGPITANTELIVAMQQASELAFRRARFGDSQSQTAKKVVTSRFLSSRN